MNRSRTNALREYTASPTRFGEAANGNIRRAALTAAALLALAVPATADMLALPAAASAAVAVNAPPVGIAGTSDGKGYWEVASDGGIFAFGDAGFYGSMSGQPLNAPVVGVAGTPDGKGYWEVASDGGIFGLGDGHYYGSVQYTSPSSPGTLVTPGAEQTYAYSLFPGYGWGSDQQSYLYNLWMRESSWNPEARNQKSGAYGIPQALNKGGKGIPYPAAYDAANPPPRGTSDPGTQIRWGESYIKSAYGTPKKAWDHEVQYGWY